ncbi:MAG: phosphoglucosamine mutase, partial [Thermoproteota archaeon]
MGRLFGTAGLRGVFGREVTVQLALNFGNGIARMSGGAVLLGWDNRLSSHALASAAASGALSGGADVLLVGMCPFPVLARATMEAGDAGIYVTASHNPPEYNGLKAFWGDGAELTREQEEELEKMVEEFAYGEVIGSIQWSPYGVEEYVEDLLEAVGPSSSVLVVADPANGAASILAPSVLSETGARVISVNSRPDGTFPGRMPEPSPENLRETMDLVRRAGAELGLAWDGDADRIAVIDGRGRFVPQYKVSSLAAMALRARRVITSVDMGLGLRRVVEGLGGEVVEWRLGDLHSLY